MYNFRCLNGLELQVSPSPSPVLKGDKTEDGLGRTLGKSVLLNRFGLVYYCSNELREMR